MMRSGPLEASLVPGTVTLTSLKERPARSSRRGSLILKVKRDGTGSMMS